MPRIDTYFDEMIKSLTIANLNYMDAILEKKRRRLININITAN